MDIFTLTDEEGRLFHPVRQAATFAKYSRSSESAHDLVKQTDEVAASKFQQKWIVNFGHNAIAELATIPVAFEGVSIVASKVIESWERPGVCEKSTRMQHFSKDSLYIPDGVSQQSLDAVMPLVDECFDLYEAFLKELPAVLAKTVPDASKIQLERAVFDIARYLLPAGCRTNLGICAYPRDIAEMISVLSGSSNSEFQAIGTQLKSATEELGGPLIRHTEPDTWSDRFPLPRVSKAFGQNGHRHTEPDTWRDRFPLPRVSNAFGQNEVFLTSTNITEVQFWTLLRNRYGWTLKEMHSIMADRPKHHSVPKFFREVQLDYSIYMDYGAFRDLQRHRRMLQFVEPLTPVYGFTTPPNLELIATDAYQAMNNVLQKFNQLDWPNNPLQQLLCQYFVPLAFRVGWHVKIDLQQLYYLVELRTQEAGHPSYRQVAYDIWDQASEQFPFMTRWIRPRGPRPYTPKEEKRISLKP